MSASPVDPARRRYPVATLAAWAARLLETAQVPPADAKVTAEVLLRSDLRGFGTHGLARLASYWQRLVQGEFNPRPRIGFDKHGAVWRVDADGALGQVAGQRVVEEAAGFLKAEPLLWVNLTECAHLGALGMFALAAAERGMICFMGQRVPPLLGLPGFKQRALGHNPIAFGAPVGDGQPPFIFDMACSVAARGHILLAAREGKPIPPDWALTSDGEPTTDAKQAVDGMLRPTGDHKGMGIAMMVECLAAALAATAPANVSPIMETGASGAMPRQSAFLMFLNPGLIDDRSAYHAYMQHWIAFYKESGGEAARVPGARGEESERVGRAEGVAYPPTIEAELRALGAKAGVAFPD